MKKKYVGGLLRPDYAMSDFARRQRAAAARAARYVSAQSKASRMVTLPRRVTAECSHRGQKAAPHYLVYLTQEEIALVLALTAHSPSGVTGPKGVLCANTEGPNETIVIDSDSDEDVEVVEQSSGPPEQSGPPGFDPEDYNTWGWKAAPVEEGDDNGLIGAKVYFKDDDAMGTITHYLPEGWDGDEETQRVWYYRLDGEEDEAVGFEFEQRMLWESEEDDMKELKRVLKDATKKKKGFFDVGTRQKVFKKGAVRADGSIRQGRKATKGGLSLHRNGLKKQRKRGSSSAKRAVVKGDGDEFEPGDYVYYAYPEEDQDKPGTFNTTWHAGYVQKARPNDDPLYMRFETTADGLDLVPANQRVTVVPLQDENAWTQRDASGGAAKVAVNDFDGPGFSKMMVTDTEYLRVFDNDMSGTDEDPHGFAIKHMEPAPDRPGAGYMPKLLIEFGDVDCADLATRLGMGVEEYLKKQRIISKAHYDSGVKVDLNGRVRDQDADDREAGRCVFYGPNKKKRLDYQYTAAEREEADRMEADRKAQNKKSDNLSKEDSTLVAMGTTYDGKRRMVPKALKDEIDARMARKTADAARKAQLRNVNAIADAKERANALAAQAEQQQAQAEEAAAQDAIDQAKADQGEVGAEVSQDVASVRAAVRAELISMGADADAILADFDEADKNGEYEDDEDRIGALEDLVNIAEVKTEKSAGKLFETTTEDPDIIMSSDSDDDED